MAIVRINTSDTDWIKRYGAESEAIAFGTDVKGVMYFQVEISVERVERVKFAGASMIRFSFGVDAPRDHTSAAMYPDKYLVSE